MKALILAAGLGSRLRPLTENKPKALVNVAGKTLIEHVIIHLRDTGVNEIVINLHHYGGLLKEYIEKLNYRDIKFHFSDETDLLLDTGGAIKQASCFLKGNIPFIVYNVDVLSNIDLKDMMRHHYASGNDITLAVRNRGSSRYFLFDSHNMLAGWENTKTGEIRMVKEINTELSYMAFSGIQILNPAVPEIMPAGEKFPVVDFYLRFARELQIGAYNHDQTFWFDSGTVEKIAEAEKFLLRQSLNNNN